MKKVIGIVSIIIMLTSLSACSLKTSDTLKSQEKSVVSGNNSEKAKANSYVDLDKLPQKYNSELARRNGDVVDVHGINFNIDKLDIFIKNFENKKSTLKDMVRITAYTDEGDAIIRDLIVDNKNIKLIEDNTRDNFSVPADRKKTEYKIVDILKTNENGGTVYTAKTDKGEERYLFFINAK
ncbi:MAG: DUF4362 domain-containing protein [Bacillota bacterium]|nr:DUF4362 domain-containing protein [Bacillota bacterium]